MKAAATTVFEFAQ